MRLLVSAGGTGGGVYPALAVIHALGERAEVLWVGGEGGMEGRLGGRGGVPRGGGGAGGGGVQASRVRRAPQLGCMASGCALSRGTSAVAGAASPPRAGSFAASSPR